MPVEGDRSPPPGGSCGEENPAGEPPQAVYLVPLYAVAIVDPNELGESGLPLNLGDEATGPEVAVEQKRQKLVTRKRGAILEYDDDDPHKPTPKRLRNRMKSQKSRDKKKAYMSALESKVEELEKMISKLEEKCLILQNENEALKNQNITSLTEPTSTYLSAEEALETDPGVEETLMLYYEKLQMDKETTGKSVENQEHGPAKSAQSQEGFWEKCAEITGQEDTPKIDIDEVTLETEITAKCGEVPGQEGIADEFSEAEDLACTSEMNAQEGAPLKFDSANSQEGTLRRCTDIVDNNALNEEDCVVQHSVTKR